MQRSIYNRHTRSRGASQRNTVLPEHDDDTEICQDRRARRCARFKEKGLTREEVVRCRVMCLLILPTNTYSTVHALAIAATRRSKCTMYTVYGASYALRATRELLFIFQPLLFLKIVLKSKQFILLIIMHTIWRCKHLEINQSMVPGT